MLDIGALLPLALVKKEKTNLSPDGTACVLHLIGHSFGVTKPVRVQTKKLYVILHLGRHLHSYVTMT